MPGYGCEILRTQELLALALHIDKAWAKKLSDKMTALIKMYCHPQAESVLKLL